MVTEELVDLWVHRLRREIPDAVAIYLGGSQLRGDAGPYSDVDFDVVVEHGPVDEGPGWVAEDGHRLLHISTWIRDVETWLAAFTEPQDWAFCLPCADQVQLRWVADESWARRVGNAGLTYPPGMPEIGHFEGEVAKLANAWRGGDDLALRLTAQDFARSVVSLLRPLNPRPPVHSRLGALRCLLSFDVAPAGYRDDVVTCLGLSGIATAAQLHAAARRLTNGVLELLHTHESTLTALVPDHAAQSLRDGTLRRHVLQILAAFNE
jgi:hypothetical protein